MAESRETNDVSVSGSSSITIGDAIALATANSEAEQLLPTATSPPIKEYQSNAAANIAYDRQPGEGEGAYDRSPEGRGENGITATTTAIHGQAEEPITMGARSRGWYDFGGREKPTTANNAEAWESYFRGPLIRSTATIKVAKSLIIVMGVVIGMLLEYA